MRIILYTYFYANCFYLQLWVNKNRAYVANQIARTERRVIENDKTLYVLSNISHESETKTISSITLYSYFRCRRFQRPMRSALVCASAHAARLLRSAPHFAFCLLPNRIAAEMTPAAQCSNRAPKTCLHSLEINLIIGAKYYVDRVDELLRLCVRRNAELVAHDSEKRGVGERRQFSTTTAEKRAHLAVFAQSD